MKSKFLYGAMALATVLSACTSEVMEPTTADFSAVKGHDLVSKGMTITATNGTDTRVDAGGWELTDRVGLAWYDVKGDITGVQTTADYAAKKGTDADKKIYANNILTVKNDFSAFETRANIYQGAYFVYSPWAYMSQIGELKFDVNGTQESDFDTERFNKVPWISASKYIAASAAPQNGDYSESYVLNPVQNVVKVKATPSAGVASALAAYKIAGVTLTALDTENESYGTATGLGANIFASTMTVDPNALPDAAETTNTDAAVKAMVTPEYANAAAEATTTLDVDYTLDAAREIRVFMFPTNGENYINATGDDVVVPATTITIPVTNAAGNEIGYFEINENDLVAANAGAVQKLGEFLTPRVYDEDGNYLAGGFGGVAYTPAWDEPTSTPVDPSTLLPEPDPAYNDADPNDPTHTPVPGLEVIDNGDGTYTYIKHWLTTESSSVGSIHHPAVPGTEGKTLTEILRTDAGKPTFVNLPVTLTADNFHFSDYISNIAEWNERVALVDALYGSTNGVVSFIIDGEIEFTNEVKVPACATTLNVTAVAGGSMKLTGTATLPTNVKGNAVAADLHEGDTGLLPEFNVMENAVLYITKATDGIKFGTQTHQTTSSLDGYIYLTTTASTVDMSSTLGNQGSVYIYEHATENVANGASAVVANAEGTSVIYLVDTDDLVDAGAIDNLLANAPVSDFHVLGYTLTMANTTSTAAINLMEVDGNVIGDGVDVEFNHVVANGTSSLKSDKDINVHCINIAGGAFTTDSKNINVAEEVLGKASCTADITIDGVANLTYIDCTNDGDMKMTVKGSGTVTGVKTVKPVVTVETGVKSELKSI